MAAGSDIRRFDKIIFSPGPDLPRPGNAMELLLKSWSGIKPVLGICLGLQAVFLYYGGALRRLEEPVHGRKKTIVQTGEYCKILSGIPEKFEAGLYHSWIADENHLPGSLVVTAFSEEGRIMALRHKTFDIEAVQFHPESIMTPLGDKMLHNWISQ
jgi:anthranilate synthase component 2